MGGFDEHFRAGLFAALAAVVVTSGLGLYLAFEPATIAIVSSGSFVVLLVGSLIPDVDVHSSIPRRYLGRLLVLAGLGAAVVVSIVYPEIPRSIGASVIAVVGVDVVPGAVIGDGALLVGGLLAAKAAGYGLDELTTHRGFLHSIPFAICFGVVAFLVFAAIPLLAALQAGIVGASGTVGVLVHTHWVDR